MSDTEDTVFVECSDGERESGDREPSVEVLPNNSNNGEVSVQPDVMGEREDIVQASQAVKRVKSAIQYHDDESLQEALDKIKERPRIDAEFQEKVTALQSLLEIEQYAYFHDVVEEVLKDLVDAQERAREGKTSLSRPIEILGEVLPVFTKACEVYTEKVESSPQVNKSLRQLEKIRLELKECERIDVGDVDKAKKLEKMGEKMLEDAVEHSLEDVERVKQIINREETAGTLAYFEDTRKETNERMDFLTGDFEQMKNNCADDIQLTESALEVQIQCKERALAKFEEKDKELEEGIRVQMEKEDELRRRLEELEEQRRALEEDREIRKAMQAKANVVHKQAEDELQQLLGNLSDLLVKVDVANVVLKKTKGVCNMLFNKAVESKNVQNQDLVNVLLLTKINRHNALIAQGVNCLNIQERERGTIVMLKDKIKKKKEKLQDLLKRHLASEAKKASDKIKAMQSDLDLSKKTLDKVSEKLVILKQQISDVERELNAAGTSYVTLDKKYAEFKKLDDGDHDDGMSMPSMTSLP